MVLQVAVVALKLLSVLLSLLLLVVAVGWLKGADNIALPGLGVIVATPLLMVIMALLLIVVAVAEMAMWALVR